MARRTVNDCLTICRRGAQRHGRTSPLILCTFLSSGVLDARVSAHVLISLDTNIAKEDDGCYKICSKLIIIESIGIIISMPSSALHPEDNPKVQHL